MTLANPFIGAAASAAVETLLEASLKGTVVLAGAAFVVFVLHRASAAHRHLVWACALSGVIALPALLTLPAWRVTAPALAWLSPVSRPAQSPLAPLPRPQTPDRQGAKAGTTAPAPSPGVPTTGGAPPTDEATPMGLAPAPGPEASGETRLPWTAVALAVWAIGALAVLCAFVVGHFQLRLLLRGARPVYDGEWHALAKEAAAQLGLKRRFTLLHGGSVLVPVACGFLRPRVLLPAGSDSWSIELRRAVPLHELAHVHRHDCLMQAIAQLACAQFWFHPGVWWAASRLRAERERACDDRVLAARTRASDYADHLLGVIRSLRTRRLAALGAVAFARPSSLEGRLLAVLDPHRDRRAVRLSVAASVAMVAALLVVPFAVLKPVEARSVRADSQKPHHRGADPNALRPSRMAAVPEPQRTLEERVAWAGEDAQRSSAHVWWIGWRIQCSPSLKGNLLSDSEGISIDILEERGLFTLGDVLAGRGQGTWNMAGASSREREESEPKPTAVLVRMKAGTPDRVRVQSLTLPAEFAGAPLYWMDSVRDEQIFVWLRDQSGKARDEQLRGQFVESVGYMSRSELVTPFLKATLDAPGGEQVRMGAAEGLGRHPSREVARLLASHARSDRSPEVRRASVEALGQLQTPDALEELLVIARAGEGNEVARRAAYDALGEKVSRRAVSATPASEAEMERTEREAEAKERQSEQADQQNEQDERDAGEADSGSDEPSPPMSAGDLEVQQQAIESLGRYPEAQSLPRLRHIAETSPYGDLRGQAVESIGRLSTPGALGVLDQIAWKNSQPEARERAVEVLGRRYPADEALEKLSPIARSHPSPGTRRVAVEMIGRVDSPRSLEMLQQVVKSGTDRESQRQAVESMGRRSEPGIEGQLIQVARTHRSIEVRRQAVESLGNRDGKQVARELLEIASAKGPVEVQRQAVESLARLDAEVMPDLARIARSHPSSEVRRQAVDSMVRRDADKALPLLEGILRQPGGKAGI